MTKTVAPPDGGWGWVVAGASGTILGLTWGQQKAYGIFMLDIMERLGTDVQETSTILGVAIAISLLIGPPTSYLCTRFGHRKIALIGGLLSALGLMLGYVSHSLFSLYITFGVVVGVGNGLCVIPAFSLTSDYFDKRAATASGIVVAGAGVGGLVLPLIANALVAEYAYTGASLINGAIVLHTAACAGLLRPLPTCAATRTDAGVTFTRFETAPSAVDLPAVADAVAKQQPRHAFRWSALADARFWVFTLCMCLLDFGMFNIAVYLPIKSIEIGGEDANTALAVSLSSATDTLARILLCTVLFDSKHFRGIYARQMGFVITMAGAGVLMSLAAVMDQQWSFLVWSAATGFFIGGALSPTFVMMKQIAGADAFADSLAVDFLLEGPVTFVAPILLGNIYDSSSSTNTPFLAMGMFGLSSAVTGLLLPLLTRYVYRDKHKVASDDSNLTTPVEDNFYAAIFVTHF